MDEWYRSGEADKFRAEARARRARRTAACAGRVSAGGRRPARARRERPPPYVRRNPRPERSVGAKTLRLGHVLGFFVRQKLDEICVEREQREYLEDQERLGRPRLPWY